MALRHILKQTSMGLNKTHTCVCVCVCVCVCMQLYCFNNVRSSQYNYMRSSLYANEFPSILKLNEM